MSDQLQHLLDEVRAIGVSNPLTHFETGGYGQIDLSQAHPSGVSLFVAKRSALLANLVRDPIEYSAALTGARRVAAQANRLASNFGIETLHLIAGVVDFTADKIDLVTPIVLWPVSIAKRGVDYEIELIGSPVINPALVIALREYYSVNLNVAKLLQSFNQTSDFLPIPLMAELAAATSNAPGLEFRRDVVITNATVAPTLIEYDLHGQSSKALELLNGDSSANAKDTLKFEPVLVLDADELQLEAITRVIAGESLAVETLPGSGYTQTVANMLAALSAAGKRALVVSSRRQSLNEVAERLQSINLGGLMVRSSDTWLDLIAALSRHEKSVPTDLMMARKNRDDSAGLLNEYFDRLNKVNPVLGVSVAEALRKLAELSALPLPPKNTARVSTSALFELRNRTAAIALLQEAAQLSEFDAAETSSAWYRAELEDPERADEYIALAKKLSTENLPNLQANLDGFASQMHFRPAKNVSEWGEYLRLFIGVRETLDRFNSQVFDRPLTELILATGNRKDQVGMSGSTRRSLTKLAKEYLRPGMSVPDLHVALIEIQRQRDLWAAYCTMAIAPAVPIGISEAQVAYQSLVSDLGTLDRQLARDPHRVALIDLPVADLFETLNSLATQTEPLANAIEKRRVREKVRESGLEQLVLTLVRIEAKPEHLAAEFDQCWWQSALEYLLNNDANVVGFSADQLDRFEADFVQKHEAALVAGRAYVTHQLATKWREAMANYPTETKAVRETLKNRADQIARVRASAQGLWPALASHVALSPFEVPTLLANERSFDVVIIMDAAGTSTAENLSALIRANQVVAFGDEAISVAAGFSVQWHPTISSAAEPQESLFTQLRKVADTLSLRQNYRSSGQLFAELINREFYQGRMIIEPSASEYFGKTNIDLEIVSEASRASSDLQGSAESPDGEIERVIELILEHATRQPQLSLLIVSPSKSHVDRLNSAMANELTKHAELAAFFEGHGREHIEISTLAELTHKVVDRIIFSLGLGRTPAGKVPLDFAQLSAPDSRRMLANLLVSARHQFTIVSCFSAYDLPEIKPGSAASYLPQLLRPQYSGADDRESFDADEMLADLARRLKRLSVRVVEGFGERLSLIAEYGNKAVVIEPDWAMQSASLVERVKLRPALLRALGFNYQRVHSFEVFADPQQVAIKIAGKMGADVTNAPPLTVAIERVYEDSDVGWGESNFGSSRDDQMRANKPPHHS